MPPITDYLFHALFPTTYAAGSIPQPYTEGQGNLSYTDGSLKLSIGANGWTVGSGGGVGGNWLDPQAYTALLTNAVGLSMYNSLLFDDTNVSNGSLGLSSVINANPAQDFAWYLYYNQVYPILNGGNQVLMAEVLGAISTLYTRPIAIECRVISRNPGALYLQRVHAGAWKLKYVDDSTNKATVYSRFSNIGRPFYMKEWAAYNEIAPALLDRYGWVTAHKATSVDGDTSIMLANGIVKHKITAATGVTQELRARWVDDNNCWIIRMDQTASKVYLYEKVAGVETERGAVGGVAQTWTNGTTYEIQVSCDDYHIRIWVANTFKIDYTSARNFYTATGVKVSHAGVNLDTWPVDMADDNRGTPLVAKTFWAYGDSKTNGQGDNTSPYPLGQNGYAYRLADLLTTASGQTICEHPNRLGVSSTTVALRQPLIDADIALRFGDPNYILCNLGVNDGTNMGGNQATWVSNYQYIIDAMHVNYPNARIGIARISRDTGDWTTMDDVAIPLVIAGRDWAFLGQDERVTLQPTGTYTTDGIHPNPAGYDRVAAAWRLAIGSIAVNLPPDFANFQAATLLLPRIVEAKKTQITAESS